MQLRCAHATSPRLAAAARPARRVRIGQRACRAGEARFTSPHCATLAARPGGGRLYAGTNGSASSASHGDQGNGASSGTYDVVVVGAGISGLVTAQALATNHAVPRGKLLVTEARERVGGNITSLSDEDGYTWEEGPNSFQPNDSMLQAAVEAGVDSELVFGDPKAPRFVWWENKLRPTPSGPDLLTFDLLTFLGKIRAGLGAVGLFKQPMPAYEENVEQFIRRNLGDEVFERLIEPFCSGVYAGDPAKLSMKAAFNRIWTLERDGGSLIAGALQLMSDRRKNPPPPRDPRLPPKPKGQTVGSFRQGLQTLPSAIGANLASSVRLNWKLEGIQHAGDGSYQLTYNTPDGDACVRARAVLLTVPAYVAADLLKPDVPAAAEALSQFDYPPVAAVTLSYPVSAIRADRKDESGQVPGFGQLHPRSQGITTLGTIYSSSLFPNRAPPGQMLVLCYIGGALNRNIANQSQEEIVAQVDKDLRVMLLNADAPAPKLVGLRVWPRAIPQFNVGHLDTLAAAKGALASAGWDGLFLGGNYVAGVALGKCVEYGYESASQVAAFLKAPPAVAAAATAPTAAAPAAPQPAPAGRQ